MAKNDSKQAVGAVEFDLSKYLTPDLGFGSVEDFRDVGGLVPTYSAKDAYEGKWAPVIGLLDRIVRLPVQNEGKKDEHTPLAFQVIVSVPTKAVSGSGDARKVIDVAPGDAVLVFISGNLVPARDLWLAAVNQETIYPVFFGSKGPQDVGKPSPMWAWEKKLGIKGQKRQGQTMLFEHDITLPSLPAIIALAKGDLTNKQYEAMTAGANGAPARLVEATA